METLSYIMRIYTQIKIGFLKVVKKILKKRIIIDSSGVILTPCNKGQNCRGNGFGKNSFGFSIECCCDECGYALCCTDDHTVEDCVSCTAYECPLNSNNRT